MTKKYNILYSLIFPSVVKMFTNINVTKEIMTSEHLINNKYKLGYFYDHEIKQN